MAVEGLSFGGEDVLLGGFGVAVAGLVVALLLLGASDRTTESVWFCSTGKEEADASGLSGSSSGQVRVISGNWRTFRGSVTLSWSATGFNKSNNFFWKASSSSLFLGIVGR